MAYPNLLQQINSDIQMNTSSFIEDQVEFGEEETDMSILGDQPTHCIIIHTKNESTAIKTPQSSKTHHEKYYYSPYSYQRQSKWNRQYRHYKQHPQRKQKYQEKRQNQTENFELLPSNWGKKQSEIIEQTERIHEKVINIQPEVKQQQIVKKQSQVIKHREELSQELSAFQTEKMEEEVQMDIFMIQNIGQQLQEIKIIEQQPMSPQLALKKSKKKSNSKRVTVCTRGHPTPNQFISSQTSQVVNFKEEQETSLKTKINSLQVRPLQDFMNCPFRLVIIKIIFKGPIQVLRIKSFSIVPYEQGQIKIKKDQNGRYNCEQEHRSLVQNKENIYRVRRAYDSKQKQAIFNLCLARLPKINQQDVYNVKNFGSCPIHLDFISLMCNCAKRFTTSLSSLGATCPNQKCSLPSELRVSQIILI